MQQRDFIGPDSILEHYCPVATLIQVPDAVKIVSAHQAVSDILLRKSWTEIYQGKRNKPGLIKIFDEEDKSYYIIKIMTNIVSLDSHNYTSPMGVTCSVLTPSIGF
jgi:hypothetical protein